MKNTRILYSFVFLVLGLLVSGSTIDAQTKASNSASNEKAVMWEKVDIASRDLYDGPGGDAMRPNLRKIEFIREEKQGYNKKYRIKDGSGRVWVAKVTRETQSETAAVRILWGIGYKTEINYLVPTITIPGKGTFKNARLEARPDDIERLEEWKWKDNPFVGTKEFQGLKMMMVLMTNWDVLDKQNKVLDVGGENHYIVSDLGATFGRFGNNNLPIFYRFGRKIGSARHFVKTRLIKKVDKGEVKFAVKGANRGIYRGVTPNDARWLADLLGQLSDKQISDAFRAARYSPADIAMFTKAVKSKIRELENAASGQNIATK